MKKKINFEPKLTGPRKITIKALDFEQLPKKYVGSNSKVSTFLNMTRSTSDQNIECIPSSLSKENKKTNHIKPMTSRNRNTDAIKINEMRKTSYINITPEQQLKQISRNRPLNNYITQSIFQSYNNNNIIKTSDRCFPFNNNNNKYLNK